MLYCLLYVLYLLYVLFSHYSSFNSCVRMHWHWLAVVPDDDTLPLEDPAGVLTPPTPPVVLLCDAMRCRVEDGDPEAEAWTDNAGNALPPDRFWNTALETLIAADGEGDRKGIKVNICERAKVCCFLYFIDIIDIMCIIRIILCCCLGTTSDHAHFGWWRLTVRGILCL